MDLETKLILLEERNKHFEERCNNIYEQITELRTSVQQLYCESSKNNRAVFEEILELSKKIEKLAKEDDLNKASSNPPKARSWLGLDFDNMMTVGIAGIIGFLVIIGIIAMFFFKLSSVLDMIFK